MRFLIPFLAAILFAGLVWAQDSSPEEDRGYLQGLIEDNLSTEETQVRITGFKGSLTAQSTIERLTVADADGIWLTMSGLALDWSRRALFSGRLDVTELSVQEIILDRLPPQSGAPLTAEAKPFKLPNLPVEVDIDAISAGVISLGPTVMGTAASFSLQGSAKLAGGAGSIDLQAERVDGRTGKLTITAGYSNETDVMSLNVLLDEAADGIAANALKLQGKPAVRLAISGEAPLSEFTASLQLATEGEPRVTGQVRLATLPGPAATDGAAQSGPVRQFTATLSGDVAPLFAPALAPFFGDAVALHVEGQSQPDGRVQISSLVAETAALRISGQLDLADNGLPEKFTLSGQIADPTGARVTLPLGGPPATLDEAAFSARFDAATGDVWQASVTVQGFNRDGLSVGNGVVSAHGTISSLDLRQVTANVGFAVSGLSHDDPSLAQALGTQLAGSAVLDWMDGTPLQLRDLQVAGAGLALEASGTLDGFDAGLKVDGVVDLAAESIDRFSGLAGRDLRGAIGLHAEGSGALLDGSFDLSLRAETTDLVTGTDRLDLLLSGVTRLQVAAKRDETGTELSNLTIASDAIDATAQGRLSSTAGQLDLRAAIIDLALIDANLQGSGNVQTSVFWQDGQPVKVTDLRLSGAGVVLTGKGAVDLADDTWPASGRTDLTVADLSAFSAFAGRPLGGSLSTGVEGSGRIRGRDFDVALNLSGEDLSVGMAEVDRLFAGTTRLTAQVMRSAEQLTLGDLNLQTPALTALAKTTDGSDPILEFSARLADVALFAPDFPGPANVEGIAFPVGQDWDLSLNATGPGGSTASVVGLIASDLQDVDMEVSGSAPMGLINPFIVPSSLQGTIRYDVRMVGRPGLANLSGQLRTAGSRLSAPTLKLVLENIDGGVSLSGNKAQISLTATSPDGGELRASGPVTLSAPYSAALTVALSQFVVSDPTLYRSTVDGQVSLNGPMGGGGNINGTIDVGTTEIQVSSGTSVGGGGIPEIVHLNEPAGSLRTRDRAGLVKTDAAKAAGGGRGLGLDLLVRAPSRIFIRGRGLDAEFGGQLRLSGTTKDVIPIGRFNLIRGRLDLLGKRFDLTEGSVSLQGGLDPIMRLVAETRSNDVTSRIVIDGPISEPTVTFESDPQLPEDEVVAQLLFGRDLSTLSPFQAIQLASAIATLTGRGGGVISDVRKNVGLDDLDITSTEGGEAQVRVGKYLTDDIYTDFSVDSAGKTQVHLNLDIGPRLKVKGRLDSEGDTGIGLFYQRDY